jgi:hypothetical protein
MFSQESGSRGMLVRRDRRDRRAADREDLAFQAPDSVDAVHDHAVVSPEWIVPFVVCPEDA